VQNVEGREDHEHAVHELQAAHDAIAKANEMRWDAQKRLDKLRDPLNQHQTDLGAALIDAISSGRACGIDELERPASIGREKVAALTREIETWQQTQSSVEARLPDLQKDGCDLGIPHA
jgi:predicted  nucleic acid-binding Zn-ribbon protein